jgi:hypothetical protein
MRGLVSYLLAGILVMLVLDFIAPPAGLGLAIGAQPTIERAIPDQIVNRAHKGDRLPLPTDVGRQQAPHSPGRIMIGCEPAYSPLSSSARINVPGRCVA